MVTNLETDSGAVVRFHNMQKTAEQFIKEGKQALKITRLSCHPFRLNEVCLWPSVIAYNLGNLCRPLVLTRRIDNWSLTSLQQRLMKAGGWLIKRARHYWLLLAEGHLTRRSLAAWCGGSRRCRYRRGRRGVERVGSQRRGSKGRISVRGIGRKTGWFSAWGCAERQSWPLPVLQGPPNAKMPTGCCIEELPGVY
jgi:hypothetical protein